MLLKLLALAIALSLLCRWGVGRWPWQLIGRAAQRSQALARARRLLGVDAGAGRDEIIAAHRRLTREAHPDKGGSDAAMQDINAARDLLLGALPGSDDEPKG
jgi:hypothetical protein